jgi:hypothetical protein
MLYKSFAIMVGAGLAFLMSGSYCFAQSSSSSPPTERAQQEPQPRAMMKPLAFKLNLDPASMEKIDAMMRAGRNMCFVQELEPGNHNSLIEICGIPESTVTFQP